MIRAELLEILCCPACVGGGGGLLVFYRESWLLCRDCGRKYPVRDGIPVMLVEEGERWRAVEPEDLPVPPPEH
jgi:uncharacterized protein YbaR (Trm112 family)|nr:MAG: hypothetical protein KatS3mg041_0118 [Bacteroidota bacterium]